MPRVVLHLPAESYEAFIFDCDGTLVDSMPLHFKAWREALTENGARFDFTWALFQSRAGMGLEETVTALNQQFSANLEPARVVTAQFAAFERLLEELQPIAEVQQFAHRLVAVHPLSVASGGRRSQVERSLQLTGMHSLFPVIVTQEDVRRGKPDPEMFLLAAERMGVRPNRCLVLEDSQLGLQAARAAGMGAAWVEHREPLEHSGIA